MRVVLGEFACFCVQAHFGKDLAAGVQSAMRHYGRRLRSSRPPVPLPVLRRDAPAGPSVELDVALEPDLVERFKREARRRSVDVQELFDHAVFVYVADLDRGRAFVAAEEAPAPAR